MNNNSQTLLKVTLIFSILAMVSCEVDCRKKGNCPPEYYRYELGEALDYLWAAKGSYWIYRNTKNGELDTQTCLSAKTYWVNDHGSTEYTQHITVDYEVLLRVLESSYNGLQYEDKTSFYNPDAMRPFKTNLYRTAYSNGRNNPFWLPANISDIGGAGSSITTCVNVDTTIQINSSLFEHVVVFDINIDEIWEEKSGCIRPNTRYYWARNVGLIRKDMNRCEYSWELIDYKILP